MRCPEHPRSHARMLCEVPRHPYHHTRPPPHAVPRHPWGRAGARQEMPPASPMGAFGSASPSPAHCPHHKGGFLVYSVSGEAAGGRRLGKGRVYKRLLLILKLFQEAGEGRGRGGPFQNIQRGGELANGSVVMWKNEAPPSPRPQPGHSSHCTTTCGNCARAADWSY